MHYMGVPLGAYGRAISYAMARRAMTQAQKKEREGAAGAAFSHFFTTTLRFSPAPELLKTRGAAWRHALGEV